ncbi:MAG: DUF4861 family protein [Rhodanobacter sp.]|uniref:DUF4861 family protein n=1 Tax=Rhodanobacter sp. PCA2 TaxID=2006117 RepID=UPI0015E78F94|nr:DUF4861 family protein [Rhodanobacter sp. PCA2]MBA2078846.1 hypothetical protein [Rhodanobacter sp. PCA2]MBN8922817.1 DUF4861 family protein [Rhodanobacter sp.]
MAGHARWAGRCIAMLLVLCGAVAATAAADRDPASLVLTVSNPLALARHDEVLALPLAELLRRRPQWRGRTLVARLAGSAGWLPVQAYASDGGGTPDQLLVQLDIAPKTSEPLEILPAPASMPVRANPLYARLVPERDDDFAWENEQVAFRIYGAALEKTGQVFPGIDVWSKRPPRHVIDAWYRLDAEGLRRKDPALSYHVDHGDGLDSYEVGRTPGAGGTAGWLDGAPVASRNASRVRITAMGPVRLRFEVDYPAWQVGPATVHQHKVVTLDAGAYLNRQVVSYRIDGAPRTTVAAGVAVHADARLVHDAAMQIAVWDTPQKTSAGRIATALLLAPDATARYAATHDAAWALFDVADGDSIRFASGAAWSQGGMPYFSSWQRYLRDYAACWGHPLQVRWPPLPQ